MNPISAVTHPDPYPFYAELVLERPLYFDEELNLWVASSAETVNAALHSDLCCVRPPAEPVPRVIQNSAMGEVFARLIRMNDGAKHCPFKHRVVSLEIGNGTRDDECAAFWAGRFAREVLNGTRDLQSFAFDLPAFVVGDLLGVPAASLPRIAVWTRDFVRGIALGADAETLERGHAATLGLLEVLRATLERDAPGVLSALARGAHNSGTVLANGIGLLMQSSDATAGLIGNALVRLRRHPALLEDILYQPALLPGFVAEISRFEASIQNTRRFVAFNGVIAGRTMQSGDAILVVLAAANRDPAVNPNPGRFDLTRANPRVFTFGAGLHGCPGKNLAETIASAALEALLVHGFDLERIPCEVSYLPSLNARIPRLTTLP
ncbi:MAG: cytochrome P450 [Pleurocapsa sp. SU_196_0]|nr:cytochrome P450 [Pleurocapsa sp. SU_196_0]